uniref:Uncharacterized protein n=1 Tax=Parascaris univalens TaxID=6257 RepID=A0A915AZA0_PARUN
MAYLHKLIASNADSAIDFALDIGSLVMCSYSCLLLFSVSFDVNIFVRED